MAIHPSPFMKKNMKPKNPSRRSQFLNLLLVIKQFTLITFLENNTTIPPCDKIVTFVTNSW